MQKQKAGGRKSSFLAFAVRLAAVVVLLFALNTVARAQSTATLQGAITDTSNAAVPGAKVIVHNQNTGVDRTTQTDQSGGYLVSGLLPGLYQVTISANGFQTSVIKDLTLSVATTVTENMQLNVGQVTQEVTVTGGTPLADTSTVSVGQAIDQKTVQEIPLNGRHFLDLATLIPGTVTPPANGFLVGDLQGLGALGIDTAGNRENTTNWMVNGINLNDGVQNQLTFQPSIDTVSEFKVDNSTFPAQYGRNSGAIVNIATRSGTNDYHGQLFEFLRNSDLDARNFFNPVGTPQSNLIKNDFGGDFGGPIKKNKAFFFGSYEGLRQAHGLPLIAGVPPVGTTSSSTAVTNLLKLLPAPTPGAGGDFLGNGPAPVNVNIYTGDVSVNLSQNDEFHGYYAYEKDHRFEPNSAATIPGFGDTRDGHRQILTLEENHIFSPNLSNQVRLGFNRIHITFLPNDSGITASSLGINMPAGVPNTGFPLIEINSLGLLFGNPPGEPQGRGDTTAVLGDSINWLKGRHSLTLGGEVRRFYNNNITENVGLFVYQTLTNFTNDSASSYSTLSGNGNDKILQSAWGLFAQDDYKWRPNFTINLGLRYDWNSAPTEAANRFAVFNPAVAGGSLAQIGTPGFGQVYPSNNKNFQPRVGFAWDPWGDGKTAVRAGYAIMTQQPVSNIFANLSANPPFATPFAATGSISLEAPPANPKAVSPATVDPGYKNAYAQDWNLTIQREITNTFGLQVGYIGQHGVHLQQEKNLNQPTVAGGAFGTTAPFSNFSEIFDFTSDGVSSYNALWLTAKKQVSHGLQFLASYTYSKSLDNSSLDVPNSLPQDSNNLPGEYGLSDFDARNRFVVSGFYSLPFKGNRAVSGWQFGLITTAQSGNPLTAFASNAPFPGASLRPNASAALQSRKSPGLSATSVQWIANPTVLSSPCTPPNGTVCSPGNLGRNTITGPDFVDSDISLIKDTKINERFTLQFRTETFNIFNHPSFGNPNLTAIFNAAGANINSNFGLIKSTRNPAGDFGSSRQIQFALELKF